MSQYATLTQFAEAGIPAAALSGVSDADKTAALVKASGFADGYLRRRFELPLSAWDDGLTQMVCDVAAYNLIATRGFDPRGNDAQLRQRWEDARDWLEKVAKGLIQPEVTDATTSLEEQGPLGPDASSVLFRVGRGRWSGTEDDSGSGCGSV